MPDNSPHEQAIKQAVDNDVLQSQMAWDYAGQQSTRNRLELESRGLRERLLATVNTVAYALATKESPLQQLGARLLVSTQNRIWETAAERMQEHLSQMAATGQVDAVYTILDELDPPNVNISLIGPNYGYSHNGPVRMAQLRRSSGVSHVDQVYYLSSPPNDQFVRDAQTGNIIIGASSNTEQPNFLPQTIIDILDGRGRYKPSWTRDGADVPLIDSQNRINLVHLTHDAIARLHQSAGSSVHHANENNPQTPLTPRSEPVVEPSPTPVEKRLVPSPSEIIPYNQTTLINEGEYRSGQATLASPDHQNHDYLSSCLLTNIFNQTVGVRLIVADRAGGTIPDTYPNKDNAIANMARSVVERVRQYNQHSAGNTLNQIQLEVNTNNLTDLCPAAVSIALVDIFAEHIVISRKGDPGVTLWRPNGYSNRRSEVWVNQGSQSPFMTLDVPQNFAYKAKQTSGSPTADLEEAQGANVIYSAIDSKDRNPAQTTTFSRSSQEEWLIAGTDGARLVGMLTDPNTAYSQEVNQIMTNLSQGKINEFQAAKAIALAARRIPKERDDISVQVIRIPPKT